MTLPTTEKLCAVAAGTYCGLGLDVPIVPTAVALFAVLIVRLLVWTKTKSIPWNIALMLLCSLAAFATVEGSGMNTFRAFWCGVGYGVLGIGILEIGKSAMMTGLKGRVGDALSVLFGAKGKDDEIS